MNDELQKQLAEMLAKLTGAAEQGAAFVGDQIPPLVAERLLLARFEHTAVVLGALFVLAPVGVVAARRCWNFQNINATDAVIPTAVWAAITLFSFVGFLVGVTEHGHQMIMAWFAPRLYIVEWLRSLI